MKLLGNSWWCRNPTQRGSPARCTAVRAGGAPRPHHAAQPEVRGGVCFSLHLAGAAWSKPACFGKQVPAASFTITSAPKSWQLSRVSPVQLCKEFALSGDFSYIFSIAAACEHQGKHGANVAVSFFSAFGVSEVTSTWSCLTGAATRTLEARLCPRAGRPSCLLAPAAVLKAARLHHKHRV